MSVVIRRNGNSQVAEFERLGSIKEKIRTARSQSGEDQSILLTQLKDRVIKYERRYERSSDAMIVALEDGELEETRDMSLWAWTWRTLERMEGHAD